tara:strand:+ start:66 stop:929 length:864 start_codon:yes stop_codon:yes gene_type:complete
MKQLDLFIELIRLKKPIGFMLLFWPCAWGLTIAYDLNKNLNDYFFYLILFFLGSILMRSAGCIVNDILDKELDKKVKRTKQRPVASGKISVKRGLFYVVLLCLLALAILLNFNTYTIFLALASMPLAFSYPLMKRYTYWPQLFLGITFNYGLILGWTSINSEINFIPLIFYFGAIFWTLGFDTIYGFQDIKDDEIIGIKSTSIKFKKNPKFFLLLCYLIFIISLISVGLLMKFNPVFYFFMIIPIIHLLFYQVTNFKVKSPKSSLKIFKSNNLLGMLILFNIIIGKI